MFTSHWSVHRASMAKFISAGSGKDGVVPSSGTYSGTNVACTGSAGTTTLNYTGTFTAGDLVFIHQTQGTGAGERYEFNYISSANTVAIPLSYDYTTGAQVIEVKEYSGGTISGALTCNAWNGSVGGILPIASSGDLILTSTLNLVGKGFRGGNAGRAYGINQTGQQGESHSGTGSQSNSANSSGGGGGSPRTTNEQGTGGGGAGHALAGSNGAISTASPSGTPGVGGSTSGSADLATLMMGSGGGGGGVGDATGSSANGDGGRGAGILVVLCSGEFDYSSGTLSITGTAGEPGDSDQGAGGGGAGGSALIISTTVNQGTDRADLRGASAAGGTSGTGGQSSAGRIRIQTCSLSGSLSSTYYGSYSTSIGGHSFCGLLGGMI